VIHVGQLIRSGRYPLDVVAELDRKDVAWLQMDERVSRLGAGFPAYRDANFLPLEGDLWAAGKLLPPKRTGSVSLEIRVAGAYWWWAGEEGGSLRLDGAAAPNPAALADGSHRAEWSGSGPLLLTVVPPERWPPLLRRKLRSRATPSRGG
jgi:hypothetical protein